MRRARRCAWALALVAMTAFIVPDFASAMDATDAARVRDQIEKARYARVGIAGRTQVVSRPKVTESGLEFDRALEPRRPALVVGADWDSLAAPPRPVPWSTIESLETGDMSRRHGFVYGASVGFTSAGLLGLGLGAFVNRADADVSTPVLALEAAIAGALLGGLVGVAISSPRWHRVYPASPSRTGPR
jgi:hypothetical protein